MRTKRHAAAEEVTLEIAWSKGPDVHQDDSNMKFTFKNNPTVTVPNAIVKTFSRYLFKTIKQIDYQYKA